MGRARSRSTSRRATGSDGPVKRNVIGIIIVGIIAGFWLLYASHHRQPFEEVRVAQHITCVNNLKEIGLAFKIWEGDHGDQFPFNTGTNAGGTMELCAPDKDGFDGNAWLHFKALAGSEGLTTPRLLICPQDTSKHAAANWPSLTAENVSYRLRTGTNVSDVNPHEILAVCPVDGNVLYCDGSVKESPEYMKNNPAATNSMHVQ